MASVQDRLKLKRESCDTWSTREQLCLASSVLKSGDQNWISVSRSLRPFVEKEALRPPDWFSQKSCAIQYAILIENADTPKRKKRESGETTGESIVRRLTQERITELGQILAFQRDEYQQLKTEVNLLRSGNITDDKLHKMWQQIEQEEKEAEQKAKAHAAWLAQRQRKNDSPTPQVSVSTPRKSIEQPSESQELQELVPETEEEKKNRGGRSPLLTSLLKSPSPTTQIQNPPSSAQTASPTIASLLGATSKTPSPQISTSTSPQIHHLVTSTLAPSVPERPSAGAPTLSMLLELPSKLSRGSLAGLQTATPQSQLVDPPRTKISNHVTTEITTGGIPVTESMIIDSIDEVIGNKDKLPETMDKDEINEIIGDIEELIKEEITKSPKPIDKTVSLIDLPAPIVEPKIVKDVDEIASSNSSRSEMAIEEIDQSTTSIAEIIGTAIEPEPKVIVESVPEVTDIEEKPVEETPSVVVEEPKEEVNKEEKMDSEEKEVVPKIEEKSPEPKEVVPEEVTEPVEAQDKVSEPEVKSTPVKIEKKKEEETVEEPEEEVEEKPQKDDVKEEEKDKTEKKVEIKEEPEETKETKDPTEVIPEEKSEEPEVSEVEEDKPPPKEEPSDEKVVDEVETVKEPEETSTEPEETSVVSQSEEKDCEPEKEVPQEMDDNSESVEEKPVTAETVEEPVADMEVEKKDATKKESEEKPEVPEENSELSEIPKSPETSEEKAEELKEEKPIKSTESSPKPDTEEELEPPVLPNELEDVPVILKKEKEADEEKEPEEETKESEEPEPQNDVKEPIKEDSMDEQPEEQSETKTEDKEPKLEKEEVKKEDEVKKEETSTPASAADDTDIDEEESSLTKLPAGRAMKTYSKKQNAVVDSETETDNSETTDYKLWKKSILLHYSRLATHKFASLFLRPITEDQAPGYHSVVYRPMDLSAIKKNIDNGTIRTNMQFQRDVMLMFQNAIMYNKSDSFVYKMAVSMQEECLHSMQILVEATGEGAFRRETRTAASSSSETSEGSSFIKRKRSHITPSPLDTDSPRMKKRRKSEND